MVLTAITKWVFIGRYAPGVHPVWGVYFTLWWIVHRLVGITQVALGHLSGTPLLQWYLKLLGVKIGKGVDLRTVTITDFDLISIGGGCSISEVSA